ncbi:MAG: hypothetical protein EOM20_17985, partial [Spartobacteria bacterium]|nr:hypothetical protein [Spartobacteria bacterium]
MKTVLIIYDGAAGARQDDLGGRTPLQVARCPFAASLAKKGRVGLLSVGDDPASATAQSTLAVLLGVPGPVARQLALGPVEAS